MVVAVAFTGCAPADDAGSGGTFGTEKRVQFSYQRGCFFGCPIGQPLLAGSQQTVTLTGPGNELGISAMSSDPDVAELALQSQCFCEQGGSEIEVKDDASCRAHETKHCENSVLVQAHDEGDVYLELHEPGGELIDRVQLEVREAGSAQFMITLPGAPGPDATEDFQLRVGEKAEVGIELFDAEGRELLAPVGVHWSIDDAEVANLSAFLIGSAPMLDDGLGVDLNAIGPGEAQLSVSVPGLDDSAQVHVGDAP
jgi:hypothetical protein